MDGKVDGANFETIRTFPITIVTQLTTPLKVVLVSLDR